MIAKDVPRQQQYTSSCLTTIKCKCQYRTKDKSLVLYISTNGTSYTTCLVKQATESTQIYYNCQQLCCKLVSTKCISFYEDKMNYILSLFSSFLYSLRQYYMFRLYVSLS